MTRNQWQGIHRLIDPKITLASVASIVVGAAAAARQGPIAWGWLAATVLGIFCIEAAKNASGELFDFDSGADQAVAPEDRSPFSGGKRVLVDGLLSRKETAAVAIIGYAAGIALGMAIAFGREWGVVWIGLIGVGLAYFYHAPPLRLSYRGLGELAVAITYGPLIACGTYLVQRHAVRGEVALASLPLALLIAAFLLINEFPDFRADRVAGKRTLVVRVGRRGASWLYVGMAGCAFMLLALLPVFGLPLSVWAGFAGASFSILAARRLLREPEQTSWIIPAQAWTLLAFLGYSLGVAAGLLVAR